MHGPLVKKSSRSAKIIQIADAASRAVARTDDPAKLKRLHDRLADLQKYVGIVTGDRAEMNKIGGPLVEAFVKAGRILKAADKYKGRPATNRFHSGIDSKSLTFKEMGFLPHKAHRWQIGGQLPDPMIKDLKRIIEGKDLEIWCPSPVIRAAKHWLGQQKKEDDAGEPTTATIVCKSWEEWLPKQEPCDVLLTDPPYMTDVDNIDVFARKWLPVALSKVMPTGRAYVCIGPYPEELRAYLNVEVPKHLRLAQVLVWTYRNRVGPSPTHEYKMNWQAILYYLGEAAPPLNCSRAASPDYPKLNEQFSVQDINLPDPRRYEANQAHWHKWQKPDELCRRLVEHSSKPGQIIIDPFAGTGSFLLAAARAGRLAYGCDFDGSMVKLAKKRGCKNG